MTLGTPVTELANDDLQASTMHSAFTKFEAEPAGHCAAHEWPSLAARGWAGAGLRSSMKSVDYLVRITAET